MNIAVILAGGIGSRVGATNEHGEQIPKQFVEILGRPVLAYTIEAFENHPQIDAIEVVCVADYLDYIQDMKEKYNFTKLKWVSQGGDTFQQSVMNGINYLEGKVEPEDVVIVHFGANPFIKEDIISDCIKVTGEKGNAISTTDYYVLCGKKASLKSVNDPENYTTEYVDRDTIAVMNSPHGFRYQFIADVYKEAVETGVIDTVEPHTTTLLYKMGKRIYFSLGSQINIKITRKEDLDLFEGYLLMKKQRESGQERIG